MKQIPKEKFDEAIKVVREYIQQRIENEWNTRSDVREDFTYYWANDENTRNTFSSPYDYYVFYTTRENECPGGICILEKLFPNESDVLT